MQSKCRGELKNRFFDFIPPVYRDLIKSFGTKNQQRSAILFSRQMGKSHLQKTMMEAEEVLLTQPQFIKNFYLKSGTFIFRAYRYKRYDLEKISFGSKWYSNKLEHILWFLRKRGAKQKDMSEVEKFLFERI